MANLKVNMLTDDLILQYTENNVLKDYRDINLRITTKLEPYPKGVYDQDIFGSIFSDRCNCGNMHVVGIRCPRCGSMVLDEVQSFKRFARIELPVLYSGKYKLGLLVKFLKANFKIKAQFTTQYFKDYPWNDNKVLDICQWKYDQEKQTLIITDDITDFTECSYEGLLKILSKEFPDKVNEFRSYLNQYVIVIPMCLRAPACKFENGSIRLENNQITAVYQNIIYIVEEYYKNTFPSMKTELSKSIFRGCIRRIVASSVDSLSSLFASSKDNLARYMQGNNLADSGRCVIVPDPSLKADEVMIPRHLMYETCRDEFCKFIAKKKNVSIKQAENIYKTQFDLDEIRQLFDEYIYGNGTDEEPKYVIINRAPSLHELGMFACKVKLTGDYAMKIPQVICAPVGGDFDGDTMSFYSVPKELNMVVNRSLSARNRFQWKKNHEPLFLPTQEFMHGLIIGTKVIFEKNPKSFEDIKEAEEYRKQHREFKYQTRCKINGKETTLARAILTELFNKDIDAYLGSLDKSLNAKNMIYLYQQLYDEPDRLERIQKIQEFAAKLTTISGATALKISDLYVEIDESYLKRMKAIENDDKLDEQAKEVAIRTIYKEFQKAELEKMPENVKMMIETSGRGKPTSILSMSMNPLNVGADRKLHLGDSNLVKGMNPVDYTNHAIENRLLQTIKYSGTPEGGYLTRQFVFLASEYDYVDGSDETNSCIKLEERLAEGRTRQDGTIVKKSSSQAEILVRSVVSTNLPAGRITHDMIPDFVRFKPGDRIGMAFISSLTETLTQGMLGLKHGGSLRDLFDFEQYLAPEEGTVEVRDQFIYFKGKDKEYRYPKSDNFVINYSTNGKFKKGQSFGCNYKPLTPVWNLESVIKLTKARGVNMKPYAKNDIQVSQCYAIDEGKIRYEYSNETMKVYVGDREYIYNPNCAYYYPEGTLIHKYQRFCSGVLDINSYAAIVNDYVELYYYFRKQYMELQNVSQELIEFLYVLLIKKTQTGLMVKSVIQNIHGTESFFKSLSFQDAGKTFKKIGYEGMDFVTDPVTSVILSLIINEGIQ